MPPPRAPNCAPRLSSCGELADTQRLQALEAKSRSAALDDSELQEFQRLTSIPPADDASS